jgi:hypothetical protein
VRCSIVYYTVGARAVRELPKKHNRNPCYVTHCCTLYPFYFLGLQNIHCTLPCPCIRITALPAFLINSSRPCAFLSIPILDFALSKFYRVGICHFVLCVLLFLPFTAYFPPAPLQKGWSAACLGSNLLTVPYMQRPR